MTTRSATPPASPVPPRSYDEFWPFYVSQHADARTRRLHFVGTTLGLACIIAAIVLREWWLLVAVPVISYGFAWGGHFFVEKNRPATFTYPLWSLRGDFRMFALMLGGRMDREVRRLGLEDATRR
jgi:hypothetical protein